MSLSAQRRATSSVLDLVCADYSDKSFRANSSRYFGSCQLEFDDPQSSRSPMFSVTSRCWKYSLRAIALMYIISWARIDTSDSWAAYIEMKMKADQDTSLLRDESWGLNVRLIDAGRCSGQSSCTRSICMCAWRCPESLKVHTCMLKQCCNQKVMASFRHFTRYFDRIVKGRALPFLLLIQYRVKAWQHP